jgi:hypothetical protein
MYEKIYISRNAEFYLRIEAAEKKISGFKKPVLLNKFYLLIFL